jgi:hypothetical protein
MSFWGNLFSAGSSLIGGYFANKAQQDALDYQKRLYRNKIQWTVQDANKAGIHPLAALGSPVAGAWATPTGATALGDAIGDAGAAIGQGISSAENRARAREQDSLNKDLLRAQIRNVDAATARTLAEAQSRTLIGRVRDRTRGATNVGQLVRDEFAGTKFSAGQQGNWDTNPNVTSADPITGRYGDSEILQTLIALGILGADLTYNVNQAVGHSPSTSTIAPQVDWGVSP